LQILEPETAAALDRNLMPPRNERQIKPVVSDRRGAVAILPIAAEELPFVERIVDADPPQIRAPAPSAPSDSTGTNGIAL
jgi:hypothetical protein